MPKAAVHKDCEFAFGKDEIGLAKNWLAAPPASDFVLSQ
jgi:hypothetical protein